MSEKKIKSDLDLEKDFMENNVCPKCGSKNWMLGDRDYDLKCGSCGYLLYDINPIKNTCHELNLTYKQLGEAIGLSEGSIKRLATSDEINTQAIKSCEMLLEIKSLKERLSNTETLKTALKTLLD